MQTQQTVDKDSMQMYLVIDLLSTYKYGFSEQMKSTLEYTS